jgi:MOSC domain-containing protein YiiM
MDEAPVAIEPASATWQGVVTGIFVAAEGAGPTMPLESVEAVAGRGLQGDRYFRSTGTYSETPGTGRQVTLIETEALQAAARDYAIALEPGQSRRNIETAGVALNHLVGKEFLIGSVRLRGMRLNEPCGHLAKLTKRGVVKALTHRGGLRADIIEGGTIRVGDPIRPSEGA